MRLKVAQDISNVDSWEELKRYSSMAIKDIVQLLNGSISFADNVQCTIADAVFVAANADLRVAHSLGFEPNGYIVIKKSANLNVYDGATANTADSLYLRSTATGTIKVLVF